ncbi:hypothetical protein NDU88_008308 [Pleurodeles waltl]|uniref:Uncharacterized protein n=1 Tax=Pleurodeles waltl TaxID=8319 RepID=A0AAV7P3B2_PLEWA|nr:hypothetical protein NDU88_008308 [Pleurodeles waltl]
MPLRPGPLVRRSPSLVTLPPGIVTTSSLFPLWRHHHIQAHSATLRILTSPGAPSTVLLTQGSLAFRGTRGGPWSSPARRTAHRFPCGARPLTHQPSSTAAAAGHAATSLLQCPAGARCRVRGPAPAQSRTAPASSSSAALPPDGAYLLPGPWAPAGTSAAAGRLDRSPPLFSGRPHSSRGGPRLNARPRLQPRGPDRAQDRPPVQHLRMDPNRPRDGTLLLDFQSAPPEQGS